MRRGGVGRHVEGMMKIVRFLLSSHFILLISSQHPPSYLRHLSSILIPIIPKRADLMRKEDESEERR